MIAQLNLNTRQSYQPFYDGLASGWCVPQQPVPQPHPTPSRLTQQRENCISQAISRWRSRYIAITPRAVVGGVLFGVGASPFFGIRAIGGGLHGAIEALGDASLGTNLDRALRAVTEWSHFSAAGAIVAGFSGKIAGEAIADSFKSDGQLNHDIADCKRGR